MAQLGARLNGIQKVAGSNPASSTLSNGYISTSERLEIVSTVEAITTAIAQLSPEQVAQIRAWLDEYEERRWDEQIARDEREGRLDALAERALAEHRAGRTRPL